MCYGSTMTQVSVRDLRNHTADVLRRVEGGERILITVDRRPVAELTPLPRRSTWVGRERALANLVQTDSRLTQELADALPDTVDEL
jgi:prevent-host-death family protein